MKGTEGTALCFCLHAQWLPHDRKRNSPDGLCNAHASRKKLIDTTAVYNNWSKLLYIVSFKISIGKLRTEGNRARGA